MRKDSSVVKVNQAQVVFFDELHIYHNFAYPRSCTYLCASKREEILLRETHKHTEVALTYYTGFRRSNIPSPKLHGLSKSSRERIRI